MNNKDMVKVTIPPDLHDKEYSFPGKKEGTVEQYQICKLKVEELKALCQTYGLPVSGKKANLQERLRVFSEKPEQWNCIKPGARRALRGPRIGSSKAPKTGSHKRRLALLASTSTATASTATENADGRTEKEKQDLLEWAAAYVNEHPEIQTPREPPKQESTVVNKVVDGRSLSYQLDGISKTLNCILTGHHTSTAMPQASLIEGSPVPQLCPSSLPSPLHTSMLPVPSLPSTIANTLTQTGAATTSFALSPLSSLPQPGDHIVSPPLPSAASSFTGSSISALPPTTSAITTMDDAAKMLEIVGCKLIYKLSEIPDPPVLSFKDDIDRLARQWSDDHPCFNPNDCVVMIQGHGIALKYWPQIFGVKPRGSVDRRWAALKGRHNEWKFVAEEYLKFDSSEEFWTRYSNKKNANGRMTFSQISDALREGRKQLKRG